jgi:PIN domain nuclease of toxin-antitoxin system
MPHLKTSRSTCNLDILLDTHTVLWHLAGNSALSPTAKSLILDANNKAWISFVSIWELAIKTSSGKLYLNDPLDVYVQKSILPSKLTFLEITLESLYKVADLPYHHRDPFDRLLVAQAITENLAIVSGDAVLDAYGINRIW